MTEAYQILKTIYYVFSYNNSSNSSSNSNITIIKKNIPLHQSLPSWNIDKLLFLEDNTPKITASQNQKLKLKDDVNKKKHTQIKLPNLKYTVDNIKPEVTKGFLTKLFNKKLDMRWDPFVCKIDKIMLNKKNQRYIFMCSDGDNSFRVYPATQTFHLISKNEDGDSKIKKGDFIYVKYYAATILFPNKPKIVILTDIYKINDDKF